MFINLKQDTIIISLPDMLLNVVIFW